MKTVYLHSIVLILLIVALLVSQVIAQNDQDNDQDFDQDSQSGQNQGQGSSNTFLKQKKCFNLRDYKNNICSISNVQSGRSPDDDLFIGDVDFDDSKNYYAVFVKNAVDRGRARTQAEPFFDNWFDQAWLDGDDQFDSGMGNMRQRASNKCKPKELGIVFSKSFIENIGMLNNTITIATKPPKQASKYGVNHIAINWLPYGHPPKPYQIPHLDIEFTFIPQLSKNLVLCETGNSSDHVPDSLPSGFELATDVGCMPKGGYLFLNSSLMNTNDTSLTNDLGYLYWHKQLTSLALMITPNYLLSLVTQVNQTGDDNTNLKPIHVLADIPVPQFANDSKIKYFPQQYDIWYLPSCEQFFISLMKWKKIGGTEETSEQQQGGDQSFPFPQQPPRQMPRQSKRRIPRPSQQQGGDQEDQWSGRQDFPSGGGNLEEMEWWQ